MKINRVHKILLLIFSLHTGISYPTSEAFSKALKLIKNILPVNPVIIESGAYLGSDTVAMSNLWPQAKIYAFEPNPHTFQKLYNRIKNLKNVTAYKLALSDKTDPAKFWICANLGACSLLESKLNVAAYQKEPIFVNCLTIDKWAEINCIKKVDFMWLDMEGYELFALKASPKIFSTVKVVHLEVNLIEYWHGIPLYEEVKEWFEENGFVEIFSMPDVPDSKQINVIFANREFINR